MDITVKKKVIKLLFLDSYFDIKQRTIDDKISFFSRYYCCKLIAAVPKANESCYKIKATYLENNYTFYPFAYHYGSSFIRNIKTLTNLLFISLFLFYIKNNRWDVIIASNPLLNGVCAILIAKLTKTKCIIEVNGNFESAFKYGSLGEIQAGYENKIKEKIAHIIIPIVLKLADFVKLVHKNQLNPIGLCNKKINKIVFANFVPLNRFINNPKTDQKFILLLGYPWYLKGVDLLIKAFKNISSEFPEINLKIVGHCPKGKEIYEELSKGNSKIHLCDPVYYDEVINLMSNCSLYVLASRTDSSPRVLREAMAAKKPIVAADIDGIPEIIIDGYNGLLFEKENVKDLTEKIRRILSDKQLSEKLAENGFQYVQNIFSEQVYIKNYRCLINKVLNIG